MRVFSCQGRNSSDYFIPAKIGTPSTTPTICSSSQYFVLFFFLFCLFVRFITESANRGGRICFNFFLQTIARPFIPGYHGTTEIKRKTQFNLVFKTKNQNGTTKSIICQYNNYDNINKFIN